MNNLRQIVTKVIKKQALSFIVILFLIVLTSVLQSIPPWAFKLLIDNVLGNELIDSNTFLGAILSDFEDRQKMGFFVVGLYLISNILATFSDYVRSLNVRLFIQRLVNDFSEKIFSSFEKLDIGFYRKQDSGDIIYKLSEDITSVGDIAEYSAIPFLTSLVNLVISLSIMWAVYPKLTIYAFTILPILLISMIYINRDIVGASFRVEKKYGGFYSFIKQAVSQLKIIQSYTQEDRYLKKYLQKRDEVNQADFELARLNQYLGVTINSIIAFGYATIIGLGIFSVFSGTMTAGLLVVFIFYLDNLTTPVLTIMDTISSFKQDWVRVKRLGGITNVSNFTPDAGTLDKITTFDIEFKNTVLRGANDELVINNLNLNISEGTFLAIIGLSGSGKTTLLSMLPRLSGSLTSGIITLGGKDIHDYSLHTLRENISYVPQEAVLFNETIYDTIAFGNTYATEHEIKKAAELACADMFIKKHKNAYKFRVGEEGNLLSGGQRQRLLLARAYVKNSKVLVLDEPFSFQDTETKAKMLKNLRSYSKDKTVLLVTNDLTVLEPKDKIVHIDKGAVLYAGQFAKFDKKNGFSSIYKV